MIKLPKKHTPKEGEHPEMQALAFGWNECVDEVQRLNATAQPVSDGWIFETCENEPCPNGAVVNVLGADIHLCAACSVDKKYSRMKIIALPKRLSLPLPAAPGGQDA